MLSKWLKDHFTFVWVAVFIASTCPAVVLLLKHWIGNLGSNPLAELMHTTGRSALVLLSVTLAITPVRQWLTKLSNMVHLRYGKRLSDWNWLIRLRRQLGLWCFFYAVLHASIYLYYDLGFDWSAGWEELDEKPYLAAGMASLLLLIPLAATSPASMMRALGRNWRRLHMLTYVVAITSLLHFWWMQKPGLWTPWPDTLVLAVLLGYRALVFSGLMNYWDGFDGTASAERPATGPSSSA